MARERVPRADAPAGFRVGPFDDPDRYEIGAPVEAGSEGVLYRGRLLTPTTQLELTVAVKALQPAFASQVDQWAARWRDQVELLRTLQIPGLVAVREGFVGAQPHPAGAEHPPGRNLYLVMNWVDGEPLDTWVTTHSAIDHRAALKLLLPVAVALDIMHNGQLTGGVPVVHRDIKPANLLMTGSGAVLVDFGLTRGMSGQRLGPSGTLGYIAPEVLAGEEYTAAADRYAFGATVYFLLTGTHLTPGLSTSHMREALALVPEELVDRVLTMLSPNPIGRPNALANWVAQLRQSSLGDDMPLAAALPRSKISSDSRTSSRITAGTSNPTLRHLRERPVPQLLLVLLLVTLAVTSAAGLTSVSRRGRSKAILTSATTLPVQTPPPPTSTTLGGGASTTAHSPPTSTVPAAPLGNIQSSTSTVPCLNSYEPRCGPFRWSEPAVNRPLSVSVSYSPEMPTANEVVTFKIAMTDPDDSNVRITGTYFGDSPERPPAASGGSCGGKPTGIWQLPPPGPPGHDEPERTHTYTAAGTYAVHFEAASGEATPDPCRPPDPYLSWGSSPIILVVVGPTK